MKKYLLSFFMLLLGISSYAQKGDLSISPTIGLTTPILDNGIGLHLGVNPAYAIHSKFAIEAQVSYIYTRINSTFLSGNKGSYNSINTLVGGRLYFNSNEKKTRFYINFLVGGNYYKEEINNIKLDGDFNFGYSGGTFVEINKFLVGISYDTPQNLLLKVGYVF